MADDSRSEILARLRRTVSRHGAAIAPEVGPAGAPRLNAAGAEARFVERLEAARTTVDRVGALAEVPAAVARYLASQNLPAVITVAPELRRKLDFASGAITAGDALPFEDGCAVLAGCVAGVAETGTFVAASGSDRDQRLNYLAETLIVVVGVDQIVDVCEEAWDRVRASTAAETPRLVSFITGPSRTADIEQTIEWGAHGPRRLHVLITDETP